jgi:hypothetical protein
MTDRDFWALIALLDWDKTGNDDAVLEPVIAALAARPIRDIESFEDHLAKKLHALDTEAHARHIGEDSFRDRKHFSVDAFLYARCCVVANGKKVFDTTVAHPKEMLEDMEFEALLSVASKAFERKTGKPFTYSAKTSYETFANAKGWKGT